VAERLNGGEAELVAVGEGGGVEGGEMEFVGVSDGGGVEIGERDGLGVRVTDGVCTTVADGTKLSEAPSTAVFARPLPFNLFVAATVNDDVNSPVRLKI
jgi:hypothetical protein